MYTVLTPETTRKLVRASNSWFSFSSDYYLEEKNILIKEYGIPIIEFNIADKTITISKDIYSNILQSFEILPSNIDKSVEAKGKIIPLITNTMLYEIDGGISDYLPPLSMRHGIAIGTLYVTYSGYVHFRLKVLSVRTR